MIRRPPIILATVALAAMTGCGDSDSDDQRTATGQVLEGTISDDMLPLDTITSRAPPAPGEAADGDPEVAPNGPVGAPPAEAD